MALSSKRGRSSPYHAEKSPFHLKRQKRFTLVELLVVIGIMGMLMYISMPAFSKLAKGSGVAYSATNIMSRLGLARGTAIGKNRYVALLMPNYKYYSGAASNNNSSRDSSGSRKPFPNKYLYSSTRLCFVEKSATANRFNFISWVSGDSWEFMPAGTLIFRANNIQAFNPQTPPSMYEDDLGEATGAPITAFCTVVDNVNCSEFSTTTTAYDDMDNVRAIVFKSTGQPTFCGNIYLKIGEGAYSSGDTPTITNKNNWRNIEIDQFVGRISLAN